MFKIFELPIIVKFNISTFKANKNLNGRKTTRGIFKLNIFRLVFKVFKFKNHC